MSGSFTTEGIAIMKWITPTGIKIFSFSLQHIFKNPRIICSLLGITVSSVKNIVDRVTNPLNPTMHPALCHYEFLCDPEFRNMSGHAIIVVLSFVSRSTYFPCFVYFKLPRKDFF